MTLEAGEALLGLCMHCWVENVEYNKNVADGGAGGGDGGANENDDYGGGKSF